VNVTVQSFLVCRAVNEHRDSKLTDILSVLDVITVPKFPASFKDFMVYSRFVVGDETECTASMAVETPTAERHQIMAPMVVRSNPNGLVKIICRVNELDLPLSGIYTLRLLVNGKPRSEYHLTAVERRKRT
jgi:hypothetical protein